VAVPVWEDKVSVLNRAGEHKHLQVPGGMGAVDNFPRWIDPLVEGAHPYQVFHNMDFQLAAVVAGVLPARLVVRLRNNRRILPYQDFLFHNWDISSLSHILNFKSQISYHPHLLDSDFRFSNRSKFLQLYHACPCLGLMA
jgi:hypothetical protein